MLFLALSVAALAGCTADMDKLSERLDELEARVAALEELCAQMNEDISSMQTVISALEEGMYITDVREVADGYVIEFSNGETITIRHGEDGEDGADGADGEDGEDGTDGKDGDSFFSSVEVGDEYVIFTLADGTSFQIPLEKPLDIIFDVEDMEETVLSSYVDLEIKYTVQSSAADISIEVITEGDIKATLNRTDELNGVITVCAEGQESVEGCKVVVLVGDERRVIMRSITFADLKVSVSDVNTISVPAEGATVNIYYMANQDCSVFDIFCPEWITVLETKAYTERTITLQIAPNDGEPRRRYIRHTAEIRGQRSTGPAGTVTCLWTSGPESSWMRTAMSASSPSTCLKERLSPPCRMR